MIEVALEIALKAHAGQTDKNGKAYIIHPLQVMALLGDEATEEEMCVAILHDVIEDSDVTASELVRVYGLSADVVWAVQALTKTKGQDYQAYLAQVKANKLARKVKRADLKHNMALYRLKCETEKDYKRIHKYADAYKYLSED